MVVLTVKMVDDSETTNEIKNRERLGCRTIISINQGPDNNPHSSSCYVFELCTIFELLHLL